MKNTIKLASGFEYPRVALGSWKSPKEVIKASVIAAVKAGYRNIDCANDY